MRDTFAAKGNESIHDHYQHAVTCGNCGHTWCEACDPAPAALCHWCNGFGSSAFELIGGPDPYSAKLTKKESR